MTTTMPQQNVTPPQGFAPNGWQGTPWNFGYQGGYPGGIPGQQNGNQTSTKGSTIGEQVANVPFNPFGPYGMGFVPGTNVTQVSGQPVSVFGGSPIGAHPFFANGFGSFQGLSPVGPTGFGGINPWNSATNSAFGACCGDTGFSGGVSPLGIPFNQGVPFNQGTPFNQFGFNTPISPWNSTSWNSPFSNVTPWNGTPLSNHVPIGNVNSTPWNGTAWGVGGVQNGLFPNTVAGGSIWNNPIARGFGQPNFLPGNQFAGNNSGFGVPIGLNTASFGQIPPIHGFNPTPFGFNTPVNGLSPTPFGFQTPINGLNPSPFGINTPINGFHPSPFGSGVPFGLFNTPSFGAWNAGGSPFGNVIPGFGGIPGFTPIGGNFGFQPFGVPFNTPFNSPFHGPFNTNQANTQCDTSKGGLNLNNQAA